MTEMNSIVDWYRAHSKQMTPQVLRRHRLEIAYHIENPGHIGSPMFENVRTPELNDCLTVIDERLNELVMTEKASLPTLDTDSIRDRWPDYEDKSTLDMHMHWCDLVTEWNLLPFRVNGDTVSINEAAETFGVTKVEFVSEDSLNEFVDHFELHEFVTLSKPNETTRGGFITLCNSFPESDVAEFLRILNEVKSSLSVIYDERRRATIQMGGKVSYVLSSHFATREQVDLDRVTTAREFLGATLVRSELDEAK